MKKLRVIKRGLVPYSQAWDFQKELHAKRLAGEIDDTLVLLQHPPVYTLGKNAGDENLIDPKDAEVIQSDRGGDITWHGPGQLVGYPIFNLEEHTKSVSWYMRSLEKVIINTLRAFEIESNRVEGLTGVWVGNQKICAMGVRLSRWVTMHGFALNVRPEMSYFQGMIPCGIEGKGVTSMRELLGKDINIETVYPHLTSAFNQVFGFSGIQE